MGAQVLLRSLYRKLPECGSMQTAERRERSEWTQPLHRLRKNIKTMGADPMHQLSCITWKMCRM